MKRTQLLTFELGSACNLGGAHALCPNKHPDRYKLLDTHRELDDATIVDIAVRMHETFGFRGLIAWHYYNEPLMQAERMFGLMHRIRQAVPRVRFLLWTNGTLLPEDDDRLGWFEQVHLTDYTENGFPPRNVETIGLAGCQLTVYRHRLDSRLEIEGEARTRPCHRPFTEFIIDNHGNVHLCCYDWKGLGSPGNVFTTPLPLLVSRWRDVRASLAFPVMAEEAPHVCRHCSMGSPYLTHFDHAAAAEAETYISAGCPLDPEERRLAIVFVSYRLPARRLREHFTWNGELYQRHDAKVYVVTDRKTQVPEYAECVVFPSKLLPKLHGKRVFSLCKTKNAGIAKAISDGAEVIVCTDVDVAFEPTAWDHALAVTAKTAAAPVYLMADNYQERTEKHHSDFGATGTVTMTAANWRDVPYDEACVGYGADDGILLRDCRSAGLTIDRGGFVYHIAHDETAPQQNKPGSGRGDCWNRDNGFNPDNFEANRKRVRS